MTIKDLRENGTLDLLGDGGNNFIVADIDDGDNDLGYNIDTCRDKIELYDIDHIGVSDENNTIPTIFVRVPVYDKPGFRNIPERMAIVGNTVLVRGMIHSYIYKTMLNHDYAVFAYYTDHEPTPVIVRIVRRGGTDTQYDITIKHEHCKKLFEFDFGYDASDGMWTWRPGPGTDWCENRDKLNATELLTAYFIHDETTVYPTHYAVHLKHNSDVLFFGCPRLMRRETEHYYDNINGWVAILYKD